MAFNSRLSHLLAAVALAMMAVFAWDAGRQGLWANMVLGVLAGLGLLVFLAVTYSTRRHPDEPAVAGPEDAGNLHVLLDQMAIPLVRYAAGEGARALNRAARSLFDTDDLIVAGAEVLVPAVTGAVAGSSPVLSLFGRSYAVGVSEILSDDGMVRLATLTDVEMEMNKAEAAALRDTLHILSHEIMNSLTPVASLADIAASYLAQERGENVEAAGEALEMLSRRAGSLTRFIEAYRSVARLPEPVLLPVDAGRLVEEIVAPFRATSGVVFEVAVAEGLPRVALDEAQISQAVINVLTNAVEATEGVADRRVMVMVASAAQAVVIRVSDTGPGVPEGLRANLFTAFATTKPKGTGTGLNLARQIALAHGGNLQLVEDGMTTFAFTLPVRG